MAHTLKLIYIDLRNNENPPFSWQAKDVVAARWTQTSKRERKKRGNEEIFGGAAFYSSHYMREDEEGNTVAATLDDNGLNFDLLGPSAAQTWLVWLSFVEKYPLTLDELLSCRSNVNFNLA